MKRNVSTLKTRRSPQSGMSILEVLIALSLLLITSVGIMALATMAMTTTEDQGHLMARATEYAQDKMEQLISLAYGDSVTDTTQFPAVGSGGSGLTVGGSSDPSSPVTTPGTGYVDYLDISGNPVASTGSWYYIRVWKIESASTNLKKITVTAKVRSGVGHPGGALPQATVVSLKASPF
jgi:type II secretory pathway pseudopilin PulG